MHQAQVNGNKELQNLRATVSLPQNETKRKKEIISKHSFSPFFFFFLFCLSSLKFAIVFTIQTILCYFFFLNHLRLSAFDCNRVRRRCYTFWRLLVVFNARPQDTNKINYDIFAKYVKQWAHENERNSLSFFFYHLIEFIILLIDNYRTN